MWPFFLISSIVWSFQSNADLLTVAYDRIDTAFNKLGYSSCSTLYIQGFLTEFGILVFFRNLSLMEVQVRYLALFLLFSAIGGFGCFCIRNLHKNIHPWPILGTTLFLLYIH